MKKSNKIITAVSLIAGMCIIPVVAPESSVTSYADEQSIWVVEPTIEADDIVVCDIEHDSEHKHQVVKECAYIKQNGLWGIIKYDGSFIAEPKYSNSVSYFSGLGFCVNNGYNDAVVVYSGNNDLIIEDMYGGRGEIVETFYVDNSTGELWMSYDGGVCKFSEYYKMSVHRKDYYKTDKCFMVREVTKSEYDSNGNLIIKPYGEGENCNVGKYGIANKNGIVVPCEYDDGRYYRDNVYYSQEFSECCAMKKDNKWAYFDNSGRQITDFIYDDCYNINKYVYTYETIYLPTDNYIAVSNESGAGYCTTSGDEVIPTGTFEEVRPVHNGLAWVKYEGKWGVIDIEKAVDSIPMSTTTQTTTMTTTTTTTTKSHTTTTTTTKAPSGVKKVGDANGDNQLNIADAVFIMQSLANPNEYTIPRENISSADIVNKGDGITPIDALAIQMIGIDLLKESDLPVTSEYINSLIR